MSNKIETTTKTLCNLINEIVNLPSADSTPSFYELDFDYCEIIDKTSFVLKFDSKKKKNIKITVSYE